MCEMRVETSALNKIEEYTQENDTCCKLGSELYTVSCEQKLITKEHIATYTVVWEIFDGKNIS